MRVTVVDNFDSFTYNLVQALQVLGAEVTVHRNDALAAARLVDAAPDRILISPGPGGPAEAGISREVIRLALGRVPLLGVCLGHQCLAEVLGGRIARVAPIHGKTSAVHHDGVGLFAGLPQPFAAARYHSLAVDPERVPAALRPSSWTTDGVIMGLRHRELPVAGVQFHPESFMTPAGPELLANFLSAGFEQQRAGEPDSGVEAPAPGEEAAADGLAALGLSAAREIRG
jgi:anthranilate synthase/aminodeoxychorismate synthase-like glutamine amidotransferase